MEIVTIKASESLYKNVKSHYFKYSKPLENNEYMVFNAQKDNLSIKIWKNKKDVYSICFMGNEALTEAKKWDMSAETKAPKKKIIEEWICLDTQIGSDEVGTGDFCLPIVVVAAFVLKKDISLLKLYGIHDSKKLTDERILEIGNLIKDKVLISKLVLPNYKYNDLKIKGENIESMKAKMHNRALLNMVKKFPTTKNIFMDQFTKPETYFRYLNDKNEPIVKNITFKTKGESHYPSVALASVMARYAFLLEKQELENKYKMEFPCGAGSKADEFAKKFVKKYGLDEFDKICKKNFANYKELTTTKLV